MNSDSFKMGVSQVPCVYLIYFVCLYVSGRLILGSHESHEFLCPGGGKADTTSCAEPSVALDWLRGIHAHVHQMFQLARDSGQAAKCPCLAGFVHEPPRSARNSHSHSQSQSVSLNTGGNIA